MDHSLLAIAAIQTVAGLGAVAAIALPVGRRLSRWSRLLFGALSAVVALSGPASLIQSGRNADDRVVAASLPGDDAFDATDRISPAPANNASGKRTAAVEIEPAGPGSEPVFDSSPSGGKPGHDFIVGGGAAVSKGLADVIDDKGLISERLAIEGVEGDGKQVLHAPDVDGTFMPWNKSQPVVLAGAKPGNGLDEAAVTTDERLIDRSQAGSPDQVEGDKATIGIRAPREMTQYTVDELVAIAARLDKRQVRDLLSSEPEPPAGSPPQIMVEALPETGHYLIATLRGIDFEIDPPGARIQPIRGTKPVTWQWQIKPLRDGTRRLTLQVDASETADGKEPPYNVGTFTRDILVAVVPSVEGFAAPQVGHAPSAVGSAGTAGPDLDQPTPPAEEISAEKAVLGLQRQNGPDPQLERQIPRQKLLAIAAPAAPPWWWDAIRAGASGLAGIVVMATLVVLAVRIPQPTPFQYVSCRIVLSLGGAGFASAIPGFFSASIPGYVYLFGAFLVFLVIYFLDPVDKALRTVPAKLLPH